MNQPQTWYDLMQARLFWSKHLAAAEIRKWVSKYSLDQARDSSDKSCRSGRSDASAQHTWALLLCTTGSGLCYYVLQETWPASVGKYLSERCNTVHYMWWLFYAHYVCALHARGKKKWRKTLVNQLITREENATHTGSFAELHYVQRTW